MQGGVVVDTVQQQLNKSLAILMNLTQGEEKSRMNNKCSKNHYEQKYLRKINAKFLERQGCGKLC